MLPTRPQSRGDRSPLDVNVLLTGVPKSGKTTLLSEWAPETTLIIDTHAGTLDLDGEHFVVHVTDRARFEQVVAELEAGRHQFRTVGVDLLDDLYTMIDRDVARRRGQIAAQLVEYGKGDAETQAIFQELVGRLIQLPLGVWFLTHAEIEEVGGVSRYVPKLHKRVRGWVEGMCQFVWALEAAGGTRILYTQPTQRFQAGSRWPMRSPLMNPTAREVYEEMVAATKRPATAVPAAAAPAAGPPPARPARK